MLIRLIFNQILMTAFKRLVAANVLLILTVASFSFGNLDTGTTGDLIKVYNSEFGIQPQLDEKNQVSFTTKNLTSDEFYFPPGPCECNATKDLEKALALLERLEPLFLRAYWGGKPKILAFKSQLTDSDACRLASEFPLCEGLQFTFIDRATLLEINNFPHKGIAWDQSTLEFTLKPQSDDPIGQHAVLLSINLPTQYEVGYTVEIKYFIEQLMLQSDTEFPSSQTSQPRRLSQPNPPEEVETSEYQGDIVISWQPPLYDGGSEILSYEVFIKQANSEHYFEEEVNCGGLYTLCQVPISILLASPFNYLGGQSVYAKVQATNIDGPSSLSAAGNAAVMPPTVPATPAAPTVTISGTNVEINWTAPADGGSAIISYSVWIFSYASDDFEIETTYCSTDLTQTPLLTSCQIPVSVLKAEYNYQYGNTVQAKVHATNDIGSSSKSDSSVNGAVIPKQVPATPEAPTTNAVTDGITITWSAPEDDGGEPITSYSIKIMQSDEMTFSTELVNCNGQQPAIVSALSCTIPNSVLWAAPFNLDSTQVKAKVSATNSIGTSQESDFDGMAYINAPLDPPDPPSISVISNTDVEIEWTAPLRAGSGITGYTVKIRQRDYVTFTALPSGQCPGVSTNCMVPISVLQAAPFNLQWGEGIFAKVIALCETYNSVESDWGGGAKIITYPDAPTELNEFAASATEISIIGQGAKGGGAEPSTGLKIQVWWDEGLGTDQFILLEEKIYTGNIYTTSTALTPNTVYKFKVKVVNPFGASSFSPEVSIRAAAVPGAPINLENNIQVTASGIIGLTWAPPFSDGGSPVIDYMIEFRLSTDATYSDTVSDITTTSFDSQDYATITLTPDQVYTFQVKARNLVGYGEATGELDVEASVGPQCQGDENRLNQISTTTLTLGNSATSLTRKGCDGNYDEVDIAPTGTKFSWMVQFPEYKTVETVCLVLSPGSYTVSYGDSTELDSMELCKESILGSGFYVCLFPATGTVFAVSSDATFYLKEVMLFTITAIQQNAATATLNGEEALGTITSFIDAESQLQSPVGNAQFLMEFPAAIAIGGIIFISEMDPLFPISNTLVSLIGVDESETSCTGAALGRYVEYECLENTAVKVSVAYTGTAALIWDAIGVIAVCDCAKIRFEPSFLPGSTEVFATITSDADPIEMQINLNIKGNVELNCLKSCGNRKLRLYAKQDTNTLDEERRLRNLQTVTTDITDLLPYQGVTYDAATGLVSVPQATVDDGISIYAAIDFVENPLVFPDLISLPSNDADPCLTTKIKAFNVTSMVNTALYGESVQKIDYQLDNVAASKNDDTYCGVPRYSITVQNKEVQTFVSESGSLITLDSKKIDFSDVGVWNVSLAANLPKYPDATFTSTFQVTVLNPCFQTNFTKVSLDSMSYELGDSNTTQDFKLANDTVSQNLTLSYLCGIPTVRVFVLGFDDQNFVSITQVKGEKYQISVQSNDVKQLGKWQCYIEASLPRYGRSVQSPFVITISKINQLPYLFSYQNDTSLPTINAIKGELVSITLPQIKDDDTDLKLVKISIRSVTPAYMADQVRLEKSLNSWDLIANLTNIEEKWLVVQIILNDQTSIRSYQQIINVDLDQKEKNTGNGTSNNTNSAKFDVVIQRGNQTFVEISTGNGTQLYALPVEEPVVLKDKVYDDETSVQPTFTPKTISNSVSLAKYQEMRQVTVVNEEGVEIEYELCIPQVTQISRKGSLEIIFNREIVPLTDVDIFNIQNSGVIQFQIIPASKTTKAKENASQLDFKWEISGQTPKGFKIQITFVNTGLISASSTDSDQLRVVFVNASRYITCKPAQNAPDGSERLLKSARGSASKSANGKGTGVNGGSVNRTATGGSGVSGSTTGKVMGGSGGSGKGTVGAPGQLIMPDKIPEGSQLLNPMPPQSPANETIPAEESAQNIGTAFNTAVTICFGLSILVGFPLADIWGSINSLQMIALLPFNKVTFTSELYFAFDALNQFTGFDYLNPWQIDDIVQEETGNSVNYYFGFTETDSYSDQFAWMGVDQANFVYNTGSISFVLIFIMVRSAVIPLLNFLIRRGYTGPGRIIHKMTMKWDDVIGMWVRLWHEQFITFIQCGVIVILMLNLQAPTFSDNAALSLGLYFVLPVTILYPVFLIWFSFYHVRRLVSINQRNLFLSYQNQIPIWIQERNNMSFEQIAEYFKKNPELEKKYRGLLEQRNMEFVAYKQSVLEMERRRSVVGQLGKFFTENENDAASAAQSEAKQDDPASAGQSNTTKQEKQLESLKTSQQHESVSQIRTSQQYESVFEIKAANSICQDVPNQIQASALVSRKQTEKIKQDQSGSWLVKISSEPSSQQKISESKQIEIQDLEKVSSVKEIKQDQSGSWTVNILYEPTSLQEIQPTEKFSLKKIENSDQIQSESNLIKSDSQFENQEDIREDGVQLFTFDCKPIQAKLEPQNFNVSNLSVKSECFAEEDDLEQVSLIDYRRDIGKQKSYYSILLAERHDIKIMYSRRLGKNVFIKDTQGVTDEEEEEWMERIEARFGGLYENLNIYKFDAQYANVIFILRRIVLLYVMLWMGDRSWLQVIIFMLLSLMNIIYIGYSMPFIEKRSNIVELVDEATILAIAIFQMALESGSIDDINTKTGIGYTIIFLILVNVCFSMYFVIKEMILLFIEKIKELVQKIKEKCKKKQEEQIKEEKQIVEYFDFKAEKYKMEEEIDATVPVILRQGKASDSKELRDSLQELQDSLNNDKIKASQASAQSESQIDQGPKMVDQQANQRKQIENRVITEPDPDSLASEKVSLNNTTMRHEHEIQLINAIQSNTSSLIIEKILSAGSRYCDFSLSTIKESQMVRKHPKQRASYLIDENNKESTLRDSEQTVKVDLQTQRPTNRLLVSQLAEEIKLDFELSLELINLQPDFEAVPVRSRVEQHQTNYRNLIRSVNQSAILNRNQVILEVPASNIIDNASGDAECLQEQFDQSLSEIEDQTNRV